MGGDSGRGHFSGISACGETYGDEEVPVPFGGSAGSWGQTCSGGAGGGGVEIVATGNVTLGSNAKILAHGGTQLPFTVQYPSGGGAGGSVRIIADGGNVINAGVIDVNGGNGGNGSEKGNNTGGGGGGGRVAILYSGSISPPGGGKITYKGGARSLVYEGRLEDNGRGLSDAGEDGTRYIKSFTQASPRKASTPTPRNGDVMVYAPNPTTNALTLKWYSGYNSTAATDTIYCDESATPITPSTSRGTADARVRGQHSATSMNIVPDTTYWVRVKTSGAFTDVYSDTWSFKTVDWQCMGPDWDTSYSLPANADKAGWPAWDQNHDCIVNEYDFWYFARNWMENRGGREYILDLPDLYVFLDEWMTCRARTDNGCAGWPITEDFIPYVVP
jgi:hypothetical protein